MDVVVELREIRAFLTLCGELHFARTAELLTVTPSNVSQTIRSLETRIGGALFHRTSRRVMLTPLGAELEKRIRQSYTGLMQGLADTRDSATGVAGTLRVGFTATTDGPELNRLVQAFRNRYGRCRIEFHEVEIWNPYQALHRGGIDVLVNWLAVDEPGLRAGPVIGHRDRMLAVGHNHPLAAAADISVEQLADQPVLTQSAATFPAAVQDLFVPARTPRGLHIPRAPKVDTKTSVQEWIALVAHGHGVAMTVTGVPQFRREDIALIPITDLPPLPLGLIWSRGNESTTILALAHIARKLTDAVHH